MRRSAAVWGMVVVALAGGCGGSGVAEGPPPVTGEVLGDELALALKDELERRGVFGTTIGEGGGACRGGPQRWDCTVDVSIGERIRDRRVYVLRMRGDGCWVARQTGTDVGVTGRPVPPGRPGVLRGCVR